LSTSSGNRYFISFWTVVFPFSCTGLGTIPRAWPTFSMFNAFSYVCKPVPDPFGKPCRQNIPGRSHNLSPLAGFSCLTGLRRRAPLVLCGLPMFGDRFQAVFKTDVLDFWTFSNHFLGLPPPLLQGPFTPPSPQTENKKNVRVGNGEKHSERFLVYCLLKTFH
jgi:hypothetical protein